MWCSWIFEYIFDCTISCRWWMSRKPVSQLKTMTTNILVKFSRVWWTSPTFRPKFNYMDIWCFLILRYWKCQIWYYHSDSDEGTLRRSPASGVLPLSGSRYNDMECWSFLKLCGVSTLPVTIIPMWGVGK